MLYLGLKMKFGNFLKISIFTYLLLFMGVPFYSSCKFISLKEQTYTNFSGNIDKKQYAVVKQRGYRFWIKKESDEKSKRYDQLLLTPGDYLLGFVRTNPREGGAAFCRVKAGEVYSFKITDREYLSKKGVWAAKGRCFYDPNREENLQN